MFKIYVYETNMFCLFWKANLIKSKEIILIVVHEMYVQHIWLWKNVFRLKNKSEYVRSNNITSCASRIFSEYMFLNKCSEKQIQYFRRNNIPSCASSIFSKHMFLNKYLIVLKRTKRKDFVEIILLVVHQVCFKTYVSENNLSFVWKANLNSSEELIWLVVHQVQFQKICFWTQICSCSENKFKMNSKK